jgi:enamine deaminase RidA (YjgF/YER057c/UK114 family)
MKKIIILTLICTLASTVLAQRVDFDKKLKELGVELFVPGKPIANYVKAVRTGNLLFLAGHGPTKADGTNMLGKLGKDMTVEQGYMAARQTAISLLSTLKAELGDLNKVKRIIKLTGWVNCEPNFGDQPKVINGCSDLLVSVFGTKGMHARAALGANALPFGMPVEVEIIVELEE